MATAENTAAASYTTTTTQAMVDDNRVVTHYTGWTLETGGDDMTTFDATGTLANRTIDSAGQTLTIPAGELILTVPEIAYDTNGAEIGRVSADMAERGAQGYITGRPVDTGALRQPWCESHGQHSWRWGGCNLPRRTGQ